MIAALEFYIRSLKIRDNLPIPCSFCVESYLGDRKVITLNEAYRHANQVAVRHWNLTDCIDTQSLPAIEEKVIPRNEVFTNEAVIIPGCRILNLVSGVAISSGLNMRNRPMTAEQYNRYYDDLLSMNSQNYIKEIWVWREFVRVYLPLLYSLIYGERDELDRLRELMSSLAVKQPELWHKWIRWKKYMLDMPGLPGEVLFYDDYPSAFRFL